MKRFKTKQEFENDHLVYIDENGYYNYNKGDNLFVSSMYYLFGLPAEQESPNELYPNLTNDRNFWTIEDWMLTDIPHPYEGKKIKISVTPEQSEIVQKRAEAMGYKFVGSKGSRDRADHFIVLDHQKDATWLWYPDENDTELTFDQFCEGYWLEEINKNITMKNYIVLDGKKIELSEETVKNLSESLKEKKYLQRIPGEDLYYIDSLGDISILLNPQAPIPLAKNESYNRRTLEKALKFIQLQNFADEVNVEFGEYIYYLLCYGDVVKGSHENIKSRGSVYFSSEEAAQKAIDYFGEEWIKDYLK